MSGRRPPSIRLGSGSARAGRGLQVRVEADPADAIALRLVRQFRVPGGEWVFGEQGVVTWDMGQRREIDLRLPLVAASWRGRRVGLSYVLEAGCGDERCTRVPLEVLAGPPPDPPSTEPTPRQAEWADLLLGGRGRSSRGMAILAAPVIGGACLLVIWDVCRHLLAGERMGAGRFVGLVLAAAMLALSIYRLAAWWLGRIRPPGGLESPAVALGGRARLEAGRPLRWELLLVEHYRRQEEDGSSRVAAAFVVGRGHASKGPFEIPIPATKPASAGCWDGGFEWRIRLRSGMVQTELPLVVLPWYCPEVESRLQAGTAREAEQRGSEAPPAPALRREAPPRIRRAVPGQLPLVEPPLAAGEELVLLSRMRGPQGDDLARLGETRLDDGGRIPVRLDPPPCRGEVVSVQWWLALRDRENGRVKERVELRDLPPPREPFPAIEYRYWSRTWLWDRRRAERRHLRRAVLRILAGALLAGIAILVLHDGAPSGHLLDLVFPLLFLLLPAFFLFRSVRGGWRLLSRRLLALPLRCGLDRRWTGLGGRLELRVGGGGRFRWTLQYVERAAWRRDREELVPSDPLERRWTELRHVVGHGESVRGSVSIEVPEDQPPTLCKADHQEIAWSVLVERGLLARELPVLVTGRVVGGGG